MAWCVVLLTFTLIFSLSLSLFVCVCVCVGYAPIRFKGNSKVDLDLGYSFFYDLQVHSAGSSPGDDMGGAGEGFGTGVEGGQSPEPGRRKRRRAAEPPGVQQLVEVSFRMVEVRSGILLYSTTSSSTHLIRVSQSRWPPAWPV